MLTGSGYREHTNPLFYRAKCLKLKDIYSLETAKLMHKIHNNVLSFANTDKFNRLLYTAIHIRQDLAIKTTSFFQELEQD